MTKSDDNKVIRIAAKTSVVLAVLCLLLIAAMAIRAEAADDPPDMHLLWEKAAAYMANHHWVPGNIVEYESTHNTKGKLEEETRVEVTLSPDGPDRIQLRLVSAVENGRDISDQVRAEFDKSITLQALEEYSPFEQVGGRQLTSRYNGVRRQVSGRMCAGFDFNLRTDEAAVEGIVWLDVATARPVEIHSRLISVPFMEDQIKITSYREIEYYTITARGEAMLERSHAETDIEVPRLGFKGKVDTRTVCTRHWRLLPAP